MYFARTDISANINVWENFVFPDFVGGGINFQSRAPVRGFSMVAGYECGSGIIKTENCESSTKRRYASYHPTYNEYLEEEEEKKKY